MFGLSFWEIGVAMLVALVVLGPKRLPALARTLGRAMRTLQRASSDLRNAVAEPLDEVRQPLQQMRDDFYNTVSHFERQARTELEELAEPPAPATAVEQSSTPIEALPVAEVAAPASDQGCTEATIPQQDTSRDKCPTS